MPSQSLITNSHFPDKVIAMAYSLLESGYTNRAVERSLKEQFGDDAPSRETIRKWDQLLAESCHEEQETREQRVIAMSDDLIAAGLTQLQGQPENILKHLMTLNALRGTFVDKQFKRNAGPSVNVGVFVITEAKPDVIIEHSPRIQEAE